MSDRHQSQAYPLRLPEELKAQVAESAKAHGRSMNAEIIARIQQSFEPHAGDEALRRQLEENTASLHRLENSTLLVHEMLSMLLTKNLDPELEQSPAATVIREFLQATKPGAT